MVARMAKRKSWLRNMRLTLDTYPGQPAAANEPDDAATSLPPDSGANVHLIDGSGVGISGILGMPVLRQMKLTIDYRNGAVRFEYKPR
jgi:hypothetical protein